MSPAERAGILIGSAGLALSLYNTWRQRQADQPHLRVNVRRFTTTNTSQAVLQIRIGNSGRHRVMVRRVGVVVGRGRPVEGDFWGQGLAGRSDRPFDLEPGRAETVHIHEQDVVDALLQGERRCLVRVRAACWDELDNLYRSKPITVQVGPADRMDGAVATHHEEESPK